MESPDRSATYEDAEENKYIPRLSLPNYKMGIEVPTLLVLLNLDKATGIWNHTINDAYNIDRKLPFIIILIAIGFLLW